MINLDKIVLSSVKTSKAINKNEIKNYENILFEKFGQNVIMYSDVVELWFGDGWCYKFKNKYGPIGLYNQFGVWQEEGNAL
jgi:hypothetical protein